MNNAILLKFCFFSQFALSLSSHPLTTRDRRPAHKQRCKQTDKAAQWKANGEGRMQIEEPTVGKYDRLRMIASRHTERAALIAPSDAEPMSQDEE